jgi:hypothetical protein
VLGTTLDTNLGTRVALNLIKSLLASAEVKASAVLGHDAIVKRMSTVAALYEKRSLEQQTAKAEMGALEQLFELSRLSGESISNLVLGEIAISSRILREIASSGDLVLRCTLTMPGSRSTDPPPPRCCGKLGSVHSRPRSRLAHTPSRAS